MYPDFTTEKRDDGSEYERGDKQSVAEATVTRDRHILKTILEQFPGAKKLKILELGAGRGGLSRFLAKELLALGRLDTFHATNLSERENEYNSEKAAKEGIAQDTFRVSYLNFDDMSGVHEKYDVMLCLDCFLHSTNRDKLVQELTRILTTGGIAYFSDLLLNPNSTEAELQPIKSRFPESEVGTANEYLDLLAKHKFEKIDFQFTTYNLLRHYGLVRYYFVGPKKEALLDPAKGMGQAFYDKLLSGIDQWTHAIAGDHF